MRELTLAEKEINFLKACGFNVDNGYFSDDVNFYKQKEPELYERYVLNW